MCANFEYSNTYFEDRIQMQICNNYTSQGVIIGKHVIRGFILKKDQYEFTKVDFSCILCQFSSDCFYLEPEICTHARAHTHKFLFEKECNTIFSNKINLGKVAIFCVNLMHIFKIIIDSNIR